MEDNGSLSRFSKISPGICYIEDKYGMKKLHINHSDMHELCRDETEGDLGN